jgi:DNA-binding MarR family transcriptional regulator
MCHQSFANRFEQGFVDAGLVPVAGAVTQPLWDRPEGMRQTQLAELAGITKQSVGELVQQMEAAGYVERTPDPADARARIVRLTPKGRKAGRFARALVQTIEEEWADCIGAERLEALLEGLRLYVDRSRPQR